MRPASSTARRIRGLLLTGVGLLVLAPAGVLGAAHWRVTRRHDVTPDRVAVPSDPAAVERGRHLVEVVTACTSCHGEDLSGRPMADDFRLGRLWSANLTPGRGGIADRSDMDLVRAIRHGVKSDGRPVLMMPSQYLYHLSDRDLGAVIAYLRTLPAVDREVPELRLGPVSAMAIASGRVPELVPAELLEASPERLLPPPPAATPAYGAYLVETSGCKVCHHDDLSGGLHALALPEEPPPSDLGPSGRIAGWTESEFLHALRSGVTPEGDRLDEAWMPWPAIGRMSDLELRAIFRYLRSLAPARG